jgi:hypothetical protein
MRWRNEVNVLLTMIFFFNGLILAIFTFFLAFSVEYVRISIFAILAIFFVLFFMVILGFYYLMEEDTLGYMFSLSIGLLGILFSSSGIYMVWRRKKLKGHKIFVSIFGLLVLLLSITTTTLTIIILI